MRVSSFTRFLTLVVLSICLAINFSILPVWSEDFGSFGRPIKGCSLLVNSSKPGDSKITYVGDLYSTWKDAVEAAISFLVDNPNHPNPVLIQKAEGFLIVGVVQRHSGAEIRDQKTVELCGGSHPNK